MSMFYIRIPNRLILYIEGLVARLSLLYAQRYGNGELRSFLLWESGDFGCGARWYYRK